MTEDRRQGILMAMEDEFKLQVIARIRSDFTSKFGIPRQSNLVPEQEALVVFEPAYRDENALRGLEGYSHLWLIWGFSEVKQEGWSPMVKPPKLGGNTRMGVFATRSPYRPNPMGLSSVRLLRLEKRPNLGTVLVVGGADLMDGSPIYDIKPYLSFTDSHPDAQNGFAQDHAAERLPVEFPPELLERIPEEKRSALLLSLALDPRPGYLTGRSDPYGFPYAGKDVRFRVEDGAVKVFDVVEDS